VSRFPILASVQVHDGDRGITGERVVNDAIDAMPNSGSPREDWIRWRNRVLSDVEYILDAAGVRAPQSLAEMREDEGDREHDRRKEEP
jgi:hypothetical protein